MTLEADIRVRRGDLTVTAALAVAAGGTVALLGPNGAGKTTVLRVLAGLLRLDAGRVVLDGDPLEDRATGAWVPPDRRRVGVVFQQHLLFPHLSLVDNVAFGLRTRHVGRAEARRRALGWLERVAVAAPPDSRPRALSGGQAQRVALARALVTEPRLLLLDEPMASVDASARVELRRVMRANLAEYSGVRILVTHDPLEAAALADRIVILEEGGVTQVGTFAEVTARPRSEWSARMAGLNLLHGVASPGLLTLADGTTITVTGTVSGPALATVQPRAVALHRVLPSGSPRNVLRGTVLAVDDEGDRWRVRLEASIPLVAEVTRVAAAELRLAEGGEVFASIKATEVDVYAA